MPNTNYKKLKIVIIGAGSVNFCPATMSDIVSSEMLNSLPLEVVLMDIDGKALEVSGKFAQKIIGKAGRNIKLSSTVNLDEAVRGADFVITAIEVDRYRYWAQDFHIPRKYGFRQIYGENGGPGGMFHFLRNAPPMLKIAQAMEKNCPEAYLLNYTNPEAKLVEAISKLTKIKTVGICHGFNGGVHQIAQILEREPDSLDVAGYGLNHFGFMTEIKDKNTGEDLYPLFREKELEGHILSNFDEWGLSRIMLRTFGLWPYPGTNHIGEYIAWSDAFLAGTTVQYFYDPVRENPWDIGNPPPMFVYSFAAHPTDVPFNHKEPDRQQQYEYYFEQGEIKPSTEYGIPIIEGIVFDLRRHIPSLNTLNHGTIPGVIDGMCIEGPCVIDKDGIHPVKVAALPTAIEGMLNVQGYVQRLIIEALTENSRGKLLQAVMLDPTVSTYNNAVAMINEIFELQKDIIAPLKWQN